MNSKYEESIFYIRLYVEEIRRQFREVYGGATNSNSFSGGLPDGEYPMVIDGKLDPVRMENGWVRWFNL